MIECKLMPMSENYLIIPTQTSKVKHGLYSNSFYWSVPGFGRKNWVIIVNIDVDYEKYFEEGKTVEEIVTECIEYLNIPPKSKYGKKRKRKPLYGLFHKEPHRAKLLEKNDEKYIQAFLIIDRKKSRHFWGEGAVTKIRKKKKG